MFWISWRGCLGEGKMAELTVNQLIKLILGVLVFVAVVVGIYFVFKDKVFGFFETLGIEEFWRSLFK